MGQLWQWHYLGSEPRRWPGGKLHRQVDEFQWPDHVGRQRLRWKCKPQRIAHRYTRKGYGCLHGGAADRVRFLTTVEPDSASPAKTPRIKVASADIPVSAVVSNGAYREGREILIRRDVTYDNCSRCRWTFRLATNFASADGGPLMSA